MPGQPDLEAGDVILAVGGSLLVGLEEDEVEARFGASHHDGAKLLTGKSVALQDMAIDVLARAAQSVLSRTSSADVRQECSVAGKVQLVSRCSIVPRRPEFGGHDVGKVQVDTEVWRRWI